MTRRHVRGYHPDLTVTPTTLPAAVRSARGALGWSLTDLATRAGLTLAELSRLEHGAKPTMSGARILSLARAFGPATQGWDVVSPADTPAWLPAGVDAWCRWLLELDNRARPGAQQAA